MCRNIKTLYNYEPKATHEEIHAASLQYIRKISGFRKPSKINEKAFEKAVLDVARATQNLLDTLETSAPTRNRETEAEKARLRNQLRFSKEA